MVELGAGARFSLVMIRNAAIRHAIAAIAEDAWTPVQYPGAVRDPDTGDWISDAELAEIAYTAFASTKDKVTARLIVRRVKDARYPDGLFPVRRYHPFFTNSTEPVADADITHRKHAVIETVFADLIDGPLAHIPSGRFGANSAWVLCAAITHNLLRAAGGARQPRPGQSPRGHPAPQDHRRSGTFGPSTAQTRAAPSDALALGVCLATTLAGHHRDHLNDLYRPYNQEQQWKSWADSGYLTPEIRWSTRRRRTDHHNRQSVDRG